MEAMHHEPEVYSIHFLLLTNSTIYLKVVIDSGKWPSSYENWPWLEIPSYLQGGGIVITGSAVRSLLGAMQTTPFYIWEDLYLIGLCAVKARLQILTSKRLYYQKKTLSYRNI